MTKDEFRQQLIAKQQTHIAELLGITERLVDLDARWLDAGTEVRVLEGAAVDMDFSSYLWPDVPGVTDPEMIFKIEKGHDSVFTLIAHGFGVLGGVQGGYGNGAIHVSKRLGLKVVE